MYAGKPGCRVGNYWWLLGIHDGGVEIWVATERTYGADEGEIDAEGMLPHLNRWFVRLPESVSKVQEQQTEPRSTREGDPVMLCSLLTWSRYTMVHRWARRPALIDRDLRAHLTNHPRA